MTGLKQESYLHSLAYYSTYSTFVWKNHFKPISSKYLKLPYKKLKTKWLETNCNTAKILAFRENWIMMKPKLYSLFSILKPFFYFYFLYLLITNLLTTKPLLLIIPKLSILQSFVSIEHFDVGEITLIHTRDLGLNYLLLEVRRP